MCKDLRKWCHENYHLIVLGSGIDDELSVGCGKNVSKMHYNPHFDFKGTNANVKSKQPHTNSSGNTAAYAWSLTNAPVSIENDTYHGKLKRAPGSLANKQTWCSVWSNLETMKKSFFVCCCHGEKQSDFSMSPYLHKKTISLKITVIVDYH